MMLQWISLSIGTILTFGTFGLELEKSSVRQMGSLGCHREAWMFFELLSDIRASRASKIFGILKN